MISTVERKVPGGEPVAFPSIPRQLVFAVRMWEAGQMLEHGIPHYTLHGVHVMDGWVKSYQGSLKKVVVGPDRRLRLQ